MEPGREVLQISDSAEDARCALPEDQLEQRKQELRRGLVTRIVAARELPDGIAFGFEPSDAIQTELDEFIAFESQCCGFAKFAKREDPSARRVWLEVRGPEGTREMMSALVPESIEIEAP